MNRRVNAIAGRLSLRPPQPFSDWVGARLLQQEPPETTRPGPHPAEEVRTSPQQQALEP